MTSSASFNAASAAEKNHLYDMLDVTLDAALACEAGAPVQRGYIRAALGAALKLGDTGATLGTLDAQMKQMLAVPVTKPERQDRLKAELARHLQTAKDNLGKFDRNSGKPLPFDVAACLSLANFAQERLPRAVPRKRLFGRR